MGASEDFARRDQEAIAVDLDADDVLFDLDNDTTLLELDAAHKELDRRKNAVPRTFNAYALAKSPVAQLDAIAGLRQTVSIVHRSEVRAYAHALRAAIEQRLAPLPNAANMRVTVAVSATNYIRSAPSPASTPARIDVDQAIADAIAHTPTPGELPGTLLSRAEAAHTSALATTFESCAARTS